MYKFDENLEEITNRKTTMGIEEFVIERAKRIATKEGLREGCQESDYNNKVNFTKSLLQQTDFTDEKIASLVGADVSFVQKVKESIA
jgi:hypothetical protein